MSELPKAETLCLPVNYMRNLLDLVETRGGCSNNVLVAAGVSAGAVDDPAATIDFSQFTQIILRGIEESEEPALGLYLGTQLSVMTHGNLGHAVLSSSDVSQAVELAACYFETRTPLAGIRLELGATDMQVTFEERYLLGAIRVSVLEAVVTGLTAVIAYITSGQLKLKRAEFAFSAPSYSELYSVLLGCPVTFDASVTRITFPASLLQTPLALADKNVRQFASQRCEEELSHIDKSLSLEKRIEQVLMRFKGGFPSFEHVASELALSTRTLRRRLMERDTSFIAILEGVKYQLAQQYLGTSSLSIQEIGYLLGYSDPSNFGRAFKKWSGMSPIAYRESLT